MKSEFKPMIDVLSEDMPLSFVALTLVRIIPDMIRENPSMASTLLWGLWESISELLTSPDTKLSRGQRVSAAILTEYFCQKGDWEKMAAHIRKQASHTIPEPILVAATDRLYGTIKTAFDEWSAKMKQEGRWPTP